MPAAHVQTAVNSVLSATTISVTLTTTTNNAVIVTFMADTSLPGLTGGPAMGGNSAGDTLAFCFEALVNPYMMQTANYAVAGGSTTYTYTWANAQNVTMFVTEVSGLLASSAFDQSAASGVTTATTHSTNTTGTLSQAAEFVLAAWNGDSSGTTALSGSPSNSFTIPTNGNLIDGNSTQFPKAVVAYLVVNATTGVESTLTTNDNLLGEGMVGTYKAAAGAAGTPFFMQLGAQRI